MRCVRTMPKERRMREPEVRKMLRQDVRGKFELRPLHEFIVTRVRKTEPFDHENWSFSWDGATLQYPALAPADAAPSNPQKK
jgi:hypothetical protein